MKLLTSVSAAALVPASSETMRFSTLPSAPTSTASARVPFSWHEIELLEAQLALRSEHDAGRLAQPGQRRRGGRERVLDRLVADDLPFDLAPFARIGRRGLHDAVDEQAQAAFGGDSPGRGVRVGQKPSLLELLHDVPDRGRREADRTGEHLRPDRHAALEIGFDHQAEDIPHAVGQFADGLGHAIDVG